MCLGDLHQGQLVSTLAGSLQVSDHPESGPTTPAPTSGIVGALMEVMQKRSKAIHSSGDHSQHLHTQLESLQKLVDRKAVVY